MASSANSPAVLADLVDNTAPPSTVKKVEARMDEKCKEDSSGALPTPSSTNRTAPAHAPIHNPYKRPATSITNKTTTTTTNPYSQPTKFVSGAERARKNARKQQPRRGKPVAVPQNPEDNVLSTRMHPFDRFFTCLLQPPVSSYYIAATQEDQAVELWSTLCARVGIPIVHEPLRASYPGDTHLHTRTALVLEEARQAVTDALQVAWNRRRKPMILTLQSVERGNKNAVGTRLGFRKDKYFTKDELFSIRPGTVVLCMARKDQHVVANALFGVIVTGNRDAIEKDHLFTVLCFHSMQWNDQEECTVMPLAPLVSECRAFEALTRMPQQLDFFTTLVSGRQATRTRFDGDGNEVMVDRSGRINNNAQVQAPESNPHFHLRPLNATQENAAAAFLKSSTGTLTLVQGPPGTGKTTLLVSIISRLLMKARNEGDDTYRLLVTAPTNKAISLLATRFLECRKDDSFNAILVGDAEKLLTDEQSSNKHQEGPLKSIFLYTWIQSVVDGYHGIKQSFLQTSDVARKEKLRHRAHELEQRIRRQLADVAEPVLELAEAVSTSLDSLEFGGSANEVVKDITALTKELKSLSTDGVWPQLLRSADVIFCTLVSSGGSIVKKTDPVDDLIVDEAAAATEPELYIPFHLRPSRLLAVGDPLQLPATVMSRRATKLGLAKSLHERLMFECDFPHVMLDMQYRMSCQISAFPSTHFYDSKIGNGLNVASARYLEGPVLLDKIPYIFQQIEGVEEQTSAGSYCNRIEAKKIVELIGHLQRMGSSSGSQWHSSDRIRVITFYQAQVQMIKRLLQDRGLGNKIVVATVDSSQGCEADIVLISFVRSPSQNDGRPSAGFLTDDRRMNVALTRARFQLVCVGNIKAFPRFRGADTLHKLANDAGERAVIRTPVEDQVNERLNNFYGQPPNKRFKN